MARSSPRCPGTVTNPRFAECLNCRWLPRVRAWYQPSDSSSRMTSRTFMGLTHLRYIPLCITTKLSRGQAAKRAGRRLERRVRPRPPRGPSGSGTRSSAEFWLDQMECGGLVPTLGVSEPTRQANVRTPTATDRPVLGPPSPMGSVEHDRSLPRLSWRMPSRISTPMLRCSCLGIFDFLADLLQNVRRNVVGHVLGIQGQHPDHSPLWPQEVDHANSTPLPAPS